MVKKLSTIVENSDDFFTSDEEKNKFIKFCEKNNLNLRHFNVYEHSVLGSRYCDYMDFENMVFINIHLLTLEFLNMSKFLKNIEDKKDLWLNQEYMRWLFSTHRRFYSHVIDLLHIRFDKIPKDKLWDMFKYIWVDSEYLLNTQLEKNELLDFFSLNSSINEDLSKLKATNSYCNEDNSLTIYRGESSKSNSYKRALSWTLSKEKAIWFAERFDNDEPKVYKTKIPINKVLAYFDSRGEEEIIVNYDDLQFDVHKVKI